MTGDVFGQQPYLQGPLESGTVMLLIAREGRWSGFSLVVACVARIFDIGVEGVSHYWSPPRIQTSMDSALKRHCPPATHAGRLCSFISRYTVSSVTARYAAASLMVMKGLVCSC